MERLTRGNPGIGAGNLLELADAAPLATAGQVGAGDSSGTFDAAVSVAFIATKAETRGMWLGLIGVAIFSLTLPFTRIAVAELDPLFVALGRAVLAALCAGLLLWKQGAALPTPVQWRALAITWLGVVIGFPVFSSIAMQSVPASHGAIVLGILPLATALFGALRFGERPSTGFWCAAVAGSAMVVAYAWLTAPPHAGAGLHAADLALFAAVIAAAMGYAEGGRLAQTMGGPQVISWALLLALPIAMPLTVWIGIRYGISASPRAWASFAYVSFMSMFIGFFFWYKGLALGGIARVGQVQLLQPFLTLVGAALLLGEALELRNILFAIAIICVVAVGRRMPIGR